MNDPLDSPANQILERERERWPRWRNPALKSAPAWFRGKELDVLEADERRQIYDRIQASSRPVPWFILFLPLAWLPTMVKGIHVGGASWIWPAIAGAYVVLLVTTLRLRRWRLLRDARHELRERADWPQRLARRAS